ncbi:hypothetical protein AVEN_90449-1 [Araneus ventricosus]|uniref:Pre-C2HC domain-containing protein n=1 Tax=Araneus ventricosus TaxID=182803 RepID=A0A4Y2TWT6_ARAVE|nr:hypothetical protein AVEN_90449-1 [Araneus ventricosus]
MIRLNEIKNLKCRAKPVGEFMHVFTNSSKDHRELTGYLNEQNIQYYVVPSRAEKPIKIVIKCLPRDTETEEIKEGLTKKVLKERKKPVNFNTEAPNQNTQLAETPISADTGFPPSQETVNFTPPQVILANKEELADLYRLLKQMQIILAKVPDVKRHSMKWEKQRTQSTNFSSLPKNLATTPKPLSDPFPFLDLTMIANFCHL